MNNEELELYVKKSCENVLKKLAENPEEMLNLSDLQGKYNNLLKEKIELKEQIKKQKEIIDSAIDILKIGITTYNGGGSRTALFEVISDTLNTLKKEED